MVVAEVVDISRKRLKQRRQIFRRVGIPLLGVVLVILSILGIALYNYEANQAGALLLSQVVLNGLQARVAREVTGYLSPATQAALIARDMVARNAISDGQAAMEAFASSMLKQVPNLEGFYAGNGAGDFTMVSRDPAGGTDTKLILNSAGPRQVVSVHLDDSGHAVDRKSNPDDDFDPRKRIWYTGALKTEGLYWSAPYIFYTTQEPGITASIRLTQSGKVDRVFGVDITLKALSDFLASLRIGRTGRAAIIDHDGNVIAAPQDTRISTDQGQQTLGTVTKSLTDPALVGAFDRYRTEGFGSRTITIGDTPFVTTVSRLPAAGQDWILVIAAPQSDFTAFAATNSRKDLLLSLITIGLAAILGALLILQNWRADRISRLLNLQREISAQERQALSTLSSQPDLLNPSRPAPDLTENLAELSGARRASLWGLFNSGQVLRCEDSFDRQQNGHVEGLELSRSELPRFFEALDAGDIIDNVAASSDSRTGELNRLLLQPLGSLRVSVLPVRGSAGTLGAIMLEDAEHGDRAHNFAQLVLNIAAIRMSAAHRSNAAVEQPGPGEGPLEQVGHSIAVAERESAFTASLAPDRSVLVKRSSDEADLSTLAATYFPSVAVMVIRFDDAVSLARPGAVNVAALADEIAGAMQSIATRHDLPYMKLSGPHLVAAAGCSAEPDADAATRLADAAIAAREACILLLTKSGFEPVFRIGLDVGSAFGCELGREPRVFNLWGNAIHTAELMAHSSAGAGSIQVSEGAYAELRQHFLFRVRGMFYVPRVGTARTFILAGRR